MNDTGSRNARQARKFLRFAPLEQRLKVELAHPADPGEPKLDPSWPALRQVGTSLASRAEVRHHLRESARRVWGMMCARRDKGRREYREAKVVCLSRKTIGRTLKLSERAVERALATLKRLGMVESLGPWKALGEGGKEYVAWFYRVHGSGDDRRGWMEVTTKLARLAHADRSGRPGWGGRRAGAGRPRAGESRAQARARKLAAGAADNQVGGGPAAAGPNQVGGPQTVSLRETAAQQTPQKGFVGSRAEAPRAPEFSSLVRDPRAPRTVAPMTLTSQPQEPRELSADLRSLLYDRPEQPVPPPRRCEMGELPPMPTPSFLGSAITPPPRALDKSMTDRELVQRLVDAYCGCYERRSGRRKFVRLSMAGRRRVLACARAMLEHEVTPARWVAWRFDGWALRSGGLPPMSAVLDAKLVERWRGWHRSEAAGYCGRRVVTGPKCRALMQRWSDMRTFAWGEPGEVVERYFPGTRLVCGEWVGGEWERMLREARAEAKDDSERISRMAREGRWVWL